MADVEDERYEDDETNDFSNDVVEPTADNHQSEGEQPSAGDGNQVELQQPEDGDAITDAITDSDRAFDSDAPSPALHPPGETPESTDQTTVPDESVEKNNTSKDGDDVRFPQPGLSNLDRKIFVGGLSWETTDQDIKDYFSKYGNVLECNLKTDSSTGRSRGFAFVLFDNAASVDKVFAEPTHILNDRKIDPKKALARGGRDPIKKVFVGGLSPEFPLEDIKEYFGKYGKIVEVEQPFDRVKNQRRAFIFITYESEEIVEQVVANPKQMVGGKEVDVRKATPKVDQDASGRGRGGFNNQRGGPSRGRGGYGGPEGWPAMPPGYPPPGYDYYSGYYCPPYGAYPPGYDYSSYYDYSAYYSQPPADWSSYAATAAASYAPPYTGYDYSSWYGTDQSSSQQQSGSQAGKVKRGTGATPYHPYSR